MKCGKYFSFNFIRYMNYISFSKIYPNSDHSVLVLNKLVLQSCDGREQNQNYVTRLGITEALITIIGRSKSFQVQESCTETLRIIVENNRTCQDKALELGALTILGDILKKNRQNIPAQVKNRIVRV